MNNIQVTIPQSRIAVKEIKGKEFEFNLQGVYIGDRFVRFVWAKDHKLPEKEALVGNLYPRKYKAKTGVEYSEIAIFVTNTLPVLEEEEAPADEELIEF